MPTLKNLSCHVQWADTNAPFQEYGTFYGDGVVETYLAVPDKPQPFNIRLTSKGFIYEGLAAAVFMDGAYQCNRNRVNLIPAKKGIPRDRTEIDFVMRQKEKAIGDGTYMGRQWRFDDHNIVPDPPKKTDHAHFDQLGFIEVIVMRCRAKDSDDTNASTVSSAAESRILETTMGQGEGGGSEDDCPSTQEEVSTERSAPADDGGEIIGGLFGIFDGASDYPSYDHGRPSGYWPRPAPNRPSYDHRPDYYGEHAPPHRSEYYHDSHPAMTYRHHGPPRVPQQKHVHFDDWPRHQTMCSPPPPNWDAAYSDRMWGEPPPNPPGYAPGVSEWSQMHYQGQGPATFNARSHGYPTPPSAPYTQQAAAYQPPNHPLNFRQQHSPFIAKFPAQPAPPFPPFPQYGYQQHPATFFPAAPAVQPQQGNHPSSNQGVNPFVGQRNPSTSTISPKSRPQGQATGSLDPAKEENNPQGEWNQFNGGANNTDGNNSGSANGNNNWENSGNANTNASGGWNNLGNDNTGTGGGDNNDAGSEWGNNDANNDSWNPDRGDNNAGNNQDTSADDNGDVNKSWEQTGSGDGGWAGNNDASNGNNNNETSTPANDNWGATSNTAAPVNATSPGARPLYGPHGAYYAARSVAINEVPCDAEEEPRYDIPKSFASLCSSKQVQPGKGYLYTKHRCSPDYIDSLKEPYARFVFQYCTREELQRVLKIELDVEPSGNEEVQKYQNTSKDELIQMLLRAKGALGGKIPSPPPEPSSPGNKNADPFEPVAIEPPDMSHLDFDMPEPRSGSVGGAGDKAKTDEWNTTPAAGNNDGQKQDEWANGASNDNSGGNTGWNTSNKSTSPGEWWRSSNNADSSQAAPQANGNPGSGWDGGNNCNTNGTSGDWGGNGIGSNSWENDNNTNAGVNCGWNSEKSTSGGWDNNSSNGQAKTSNWDEANTTTQNPDPNHSSRGSRPPDLIADPNQHVNQQATQNTAPQSQDPAASVGGWASDGQASWSWPWGGSLQPRPLPRPQTYYGYGQPAAYYGPPYMLPQQQYPSTQPGPPRTHPPNDQNQTQRSQQASPTNNATSGLQGRGQGQRPNNKQGPHQAQDSSSKKGQSQLETKKPKSGW